MRNVRDDGLVSAAVEPWRRDRDAWKARAETAEMLLDEAVELLSKMGDNDDGPLWFERRRAFLIRLGRDQ